MERDDNGNIIIPNASGIRNKKDYIDYVVKNSKIINKFVNDDKIDNTVLQNALKFLEDRISEKSLYQKLTYDEIRLIYDSYYKLTMNNVLDYTPIDNNSYTLQESKRLYTNIDSPSIRKSLEKFDDNLIFRNYKVVNNRALSIDRKSAGISDDISHYSGINTLSISRSGGNDVNGSFIHDITFDTDEKSYIINFQFKLNRFPSKVHQVNYTDSITQERKFYTKQYSSRRSKLISFNYDIGEIEFAAMAPYAKVYDADNDKVSQPYKEYSPFSIACSIPISNGGCFSFYTDYKFVSNTWYNVMLIITSNSDSIYDSDAYYTAALNINGVNEKLVPAGFVKPWSKRGKIRKKLTMLASAPGFLDNRGNEIADLNDNGRNISETAQDTVNIYIPRSITDFISRLITIKTCPFTINNVQLKNGNKLVGSEKEIPYTKIYNRYLYKVSNGVDFGTISIYKGKLDMTQTQIKTPKTPRGGIL